MDASTRISISVGLDQSLDSGIEIDRAHCHLPKTEDAELHGTGYSQVPTGATKKVRSEERTTPPLQG